MDIDIQACRHRQRRLLEVMHERRIDMVVLQSIEHVQWVAGPRFSWVFQPLAALDDDGVLTLVVPDKQQPDTTAADVVATYVSKRHSTLRNDQREASSRVFADILTGQPTCRRVGLEYSLATRYLDFRDVEVEDIEPTMYELRRRKDADELARLQVAIDGTGKMYERARAILQPGVSELHMFNELQAAAVEHFGEMLTGTGNDYRCAARGGPPRNQRNAAAGELYILDLGPAYRGYFSDNCRTLAVSEPSPLQLAAWEHLVAALQLVEETVKPGVSARQVFEEVQQLLDQAQVGIFNHHLGHGIGLFPHEAPHLNPHWDDVFEIGEVFTAEPGLYAEELKVGIRLENDYVVTEDGVRNLSPFPMSL